MPSVGSAPVVETIRGGCYNIGMNAHQNTKKLKLIKIGNSTGVILPRAVLERLRVALGDSLFLNEAPQGYSLSAHDPDFAEAMGTAEDIMREDRDILAVLAR
jgi:putative addiction module antidote